MKTLGKLFYIILFLLTAAILTCVILFSWYKINAALYAMLGLFPVYVFFLVVSLKRAKKEGKALTEEDKLFAELIAQEEAKSVFLACYCKTNKLNKPDKLKRLFYAELYDTDRLENVLPLFAQTEESPLCLGKFALTFSQLAHIKNKTVYADGGLYAAIEKNPLYLKLLAENRFTAVGEKELL